MYEKSVESGTYLMKTTVPARAIFSVIVFCLVLFGLGVARAQTTNACISPLNSDFISKFSVVEAAGYIETNAAGPVLHGSNAFFFGATIKLSTNLTASSAVLTVPGQQPRLMVRGSSRQFTVDAATNAFTNLTSAFPGGDYQFTVSDMTITVTLPSGNALPNAPTLSNYAADQSIDVTKDFTLSWEPFNGGVGRDFISVILADESGQGSNFQSEPFGCPGALDGTSSSLFIPANTLASNTTYQAQISFVKVLTFDTNSIPGDALLAGTETDTVATISTGPGLGATSAPVLTNTAWLAGGSVRFDFTTTPGLTYTVQFNQDLVNPTGWTSLLVTDAVANIVPFTNSPPSGAAAGYYRVLQQ
jgi:hypothetical protein